MGIQLKPMEIDAIGEVMNISMGAAATAISTLLDKQVTITTPRVKVCSLNDLGYEKLEPALVVKITYTEGISGSNVMVLKQRDMQLILNQLMGIDDPPSDDFVFDDLSISAACEIMNQMMGSSATALSNFLGLVVNISTPSAEVLKDKETFYNAVGLDGTSEVVSILFTLSIGNLVNSEFISIVSDNLAKEIIERFLSEEDANSPVSAQIDSIQLVEGDDTASVIEDTVAAVQNNAPETVAQQPAPVKPTMPQPQSSAAAQQMSSQMAYATQQQMPTPAMQTNPQAAQGYPAYPPMYAQQYPAYPPMYPPQYPGYPPMYAQHQQVQQQPQPQVTVSPVKLNELSQNITGTEPIMHNNMGIIMNVPLSVSVEIGSAKRKIKDIMEFNQGTVIELDKQAGAPVDIVVNGQLFARGDVVVLDDNFGVRITEIIGTKELLDSLEKGTAV